MPHGHERGPAAGPYGFITIPQRVKRIAEPSQKVLFGLANVFGASKSDAFGRSANGTIMAKITYLLPNGKKGMK